MPPDLFGDAKKQRRPEAAATPPDLFGDAEKQRRPEAVATPTELDSGATRATVECLVCVLPVPSDPDVHDERNLELSHTFHRSLDQLCDFCLLGLSQQLLGHSTRKPQ